MQGPLGPRQQEALEAIRAFVLRHGYAPTQADLGRMLRLKPRRVLDLLRGLQGRGLVDWEDGKLRSLRLLEGKA